MRRILTKTFFNRPTLTVSRELLGKFLVRRVGKSTIAAIITEVEAYVGFYDKASHASRGKTPRTEVMFGEAGFWYVYLVYGMHYCLNIVTENAGYPAAILIRSVLVKSDFSGDIRARNIDMPIRGPGRVTKYFKINQRLNRTLAAPKTGLWIEDRGVRPLRITQGKRIGVDYAGRWKHKPWRFYIEAK